MTKQYFMYMFQLDRFRIFEVKYIQKTIYQGKIGKDRSEFKSLYEIDEFSTSADLLTKNKSDIISGGQAQEEILKDFPIARNFYEKWDNKHLSKLTDEEYEEMIKDLNVLKDQYNYIEKEVYKPNPEGFTWKEEVELSKMKPKNKVGESKNLADEEYEKLEENSTEEYWDAKEIIRDGFMSLMKFNFGEDSKGNNYIVTVDANAVNRFYADTEEKALEIYERFKEDYNKSEHGDLTQNIKSIAPRTENKKIEEAVFTCPRCGVVIDLDYYPDDYVVDDKTGDEMCSKCAEEAGIPNPYDDYLEENKEILTEEKPFSGVEFEKNIPNKMRFKQWDIITEDPYTLKPTRNDLYWVTQQFFGKDEVEQFANAFKETPFDRALVTVRDLSTYQISTDEAKNVLVIIDKNGNIDSTGYENIIREIGYDFDYETGKWADEE